MNQREEIIQIYRLSGMTAEDRERILKRGLVEAESVLQEVDQIIENVRRRGDKALVDYTKAFENIDIPLDRIRVLPEEIKEAYQLVEPRVVKAIETLTGNVRRFHEAQTPRKIWAMEISPGLMGGQMFIPIEKVGCYVPGGRGWFPSAVMMSVCPAKAAGVGRVVICTPAAPGGKVNPGTLVACDIAGADEVYRVGGAHAIAAMAFGTETIPRVYKITGPGSKWVLAAFRLLQGQVAIGTHAGPGEGLILADETANPSFVAADIIIQAEHGIDSAGVLVTSSHRLAQQVQELIKDHVELLDEQHKHFVRESLRKYGAIIVAESHEESIGFANEYAVEHLEIQTRDPMHDMLKIRNAGGIYLGHHTPLSTGCFGSGPNHVLPTGRQAVVEGGLSTAHFQKAVSFEYFSEEGLAHLKEAMTVLADYEGFPAHRNAILQRFKG
jgi:histidinol dehydrogenase